MTLLRPSLPPGRVVLGIVPGALEPSVMPRKSALTIRVPLATGTVAYWPLVGANGKAASNGVGPEGFFNLTCLMSTCSFIENSISPMKTMSPPYV